MNDTEQRRRQRTGEQNGANRSVGGTHRQLSLRARADDGRRQTVSIGGGDVAGAYLLCAAAARLPRWPRRPRTRPARPPGD